MKNFPSLLILILLFQLPLYAQPAEISGRITGEDGTGLPGVNVMILGTTTGVITDLEGDFRISVPDPAGTLVFSYVGMKTQEVRLDGQTTLNLTLIEDFAALDEVVVIGYGSVRKSDLTGSVASIKTEEIERVPVVTLEQAMQGRAAGVQVTTSSHKPGGGISVRVRGGTSINAGVEPLYVVDGFPVSSDNWSIPSAGGSSVPYNVLSTLNPNDIESIEILKDASSTAIYGARGANGVVLITTKRGRAGQPHVDYSTHFAIKKVSKKIEMLNGREFAELYNEYNTNKGIPPLFNGSNRNYPLPEDIGEGTDWQDQIFRQGWEMNHQLTVSGGSDNTQYAISGNYFDEQGVVLGGDFSRYSVRANVDTKVIDRLKIGTNLSTSRITANGSGSESNTESDYGGTIESAMIFAPTVYVYDRNGIWGENNVPGLETRGNPVAMSTLSTDKVIADRLMGNAYLDLEIIEGLNFKVSLGTNLINSRNDLYYPMETNVGRKVDGSASKSYVNTLSLLNENILTYNNTFGGIHKVNALAGYTRQQEVSEGSGIETSGFVTDIYRTNNLYAGSNPSPPWSWKSKWSMASWLGRINYVLMEKYLVTFTARADGSSKFGEGNKWAFFPSGAIAWRLSQEDFIKNLNVFSNLKLRFSYGLTGNSEIGLYQSQASLGIQNYNLNGALVNGIGPSSLPNPDLKWETTTKSDLGLDFGVLNNRLNFTTDLYYEKTEDLLLWVNIPETSGYESAYKNVGSLENKGMEIAVSAYPFTGDLTWNISGNISFNRNKILELTEGGAITMGGFKQGGTAYLDKELPVGVWRGPVILGIFADQDEVSNYVNEEGDPIMVGAEPGDIKFKDVNGDGSYTGDDQDIIGDPNPDYYFALTNNFSYKNFELSIFINGVQGNDIYNVTKTYSEQLNQLRSNQTARVLDRWTPENTHTDVMKAGGKGWPIPIEDGSFVRLKNVTLAYNLPVGNIPWLRSAQVYISGNNLHVWTDYTGYDPEINAGGQSAVTLGADMYAYPSQRSVTFGIKVGL